MRRSVACVLVSIGALACVPQGAREATIVLPLRAGQTSCAGAAAVDTTLYDSTQVSETPRLRTSPELIYPSEAQRGGIEGTVVVSAVVNADGTVDQESVTVTHPVHPLLDEEARQFVSRSTMWPGCRDSQPARVRIAVPLDFELRDPPPGTRDPRLLGAVIVVGAIVLVLTR